MEQKAYESPLAGIYSFNLDDRWFNAINRKENRKKVEGRLNKGKFKELKKGDLVKWISKKTGNEVVTKIKRITKYPDFVTYLTMEGIRNTLPGVTNMEDALKVYYTYFTKEHEKEFGVLAIAVKKLKK